VAPVGFSMINRREELNALRSHRIGGEPKDEAEHFFICNGCSQAVDMRKLGDVLHHEEPGHKPFPRDA
jgi:hypothetical protein